MKNEREKSDMEISVSFPDVSVLKNAMDKFGTKKSVSRLEASVSERCKF
jgi:hypothetical protein